MTASPQRVLIVDDEEAICWGLERLLRERGHDVETAATAEQALESVRAAPPDAIVLDVRLPGMDGLSAMEMIRDLAGPVPIVVITAFGNLETAVQAMERGAVEYLTKPFDLDQAALVIERALAQGHQPTGGREALPLNTFDQEIVGRSAAMQEVFKQIALVARSDLSVLITGESGTGKELVARAIHRHSHRADRPFLTVNLAALSPTLIESELFGHVRGAFTGADSSRVGLLELGNGATIFFDEVGDVPPNIQVKLLRALEQGEIMAVGDTRARPAEFRVLAATNRNLQHEIQAGRFRRDLYFRLAGFEIDLPPLRDRTEDIPLLVERFLSGGTRSEASRAHFTEAAIVELQKRSWPGNVRQLRAAVESAALRARGLAIGPEHLPDHRILDAPGELHDELSQCVRSWTRRRLEESPDTTNLYQQFLAEVEPALLEAVLEFTSRNRAAAAKRLGIHRQTLRKKLQEL